MEGSMMLKRWRIKILLIAAAILVLLLFLNFRGQEGSIVAAPLTLVAPGLSEDDCRNYKQKDENWGADRLGQSMDTMAASGCLTCCIAGSLKAQGIYDRSPGELNRIFSDQQVYNENGAIIWEKLEQALPGVKAVTNKKLSNEAINDSVERGEYPIVKVRTKNGVYHWVTLLGTDPEGQDFYCLDPLNGRVSLSNYDNCVYGIRIVTAK